MAKMCHEGWAATSLVEGVWTFEPCRPDQYTFRVCYLRGKNNAEVEELKQSLAAKGIEFVSRYSFWAIFRSSCFILMRRYFILQGTCYWYLTHIKQLPHSGFCQGEGAAAPIV